MVPLHPPYARSFNPSVCSLNHAKNPLGLPSHFFSSSAGIGSPMTGRVGLKRLRLMS